jgi:hypothetical protein
MHNNSFANIEKLIRIQYKIVWIQVLFIINKKNYNKNIYLKIIAQNSRKLYKNRQNFEIDFNFWLLIKLLTYLNIAWMQSISDFNSHWNSMTNIFLIIYSFTYWIYEKIREMKLIITIIFCNLINDKIVKRHQF